MKGARNIQSPKGKAIFGGECPKDEGSDSPSIIEERIYKD